jgi:PTS system nitrogen regulatory IIA component
MMKIEEVLAPDAVEVGLESSDKQALLEALSRKAARFLQIPSEDILKALLNREELGSTGTGGGIALPHARMAEVTRPFALFTRLRKPIDFEAVDSQLVDLVCLVLLPAGKNDTINALACVARSLRDPERLRLVRKASNKAGLYAALTEQLPAA